MGFGVIRMCLECFQEDYGFAMLLRGIFKGYLWLRRVFCGLEECLRFDQCVLDYSRKF